MVEDTLVVTDSTQQTRFLFSTYPVIREGMRHTVTVDRVDPWEYGVEAWVHVRVTEEEIPLVFFDVRYYAGSECLQSEQKIEVALAGLAYNLEPLKQTSFEICEGLFWEMQKQTRLDDGKSLKEAEQPVTIHLTGMATLLPGSDECGDDAEFHGVIDAITHFEHDDKTIYCLEIVLLRPGDDVFKLPVFVSEAVLNGYVPRLGEDVQGVMWIQGYLIGAFGDGG